MNKVVFGASAVAACLVVIGATVFSPAATSQNLATPSYVPIGVSAGGNSSTVWFHEPSSRQAIACQTVGQGASLGIQCTRTTLPN